MQKRELSCQLGNETINQSKCNLNMRPTHRQECTNRRCVGKWKIGEWSQVEIIKYKYCMFIKNIYL